MIQRPGSRAARRARGRLCPGAVEGQSRLCPGGGGFPVCQLHGQRGGGSAFPKGGFQPPVWDLTARGVPTPRPWSSCCGSPGRQTVPEEGPGGVTAPGVRSGESPHSRSPVCAPVQGRGHRPAQGSAGATCLTRVTQPVRWLHSRVTMSLQLQRASSSLCHLPTPRALCTKPALRNDHLPSSSSARPLREGPGPAAPSPRSTGGAEPQAPRAPDPRVVFELDPGLSLHVWRLRGAGPELLRRWGRAQHAGCGDVVCARRPSAGWFPQPWGPQAAGGWGGCPGPSLSPATPQLPLTLHCFLQEAVAAQRGQHPAATGVITHILPRGPGTATCGAAASPCPAGTSCGGCSARGSLWAAGPSWASRRAAWWAGVRARPLGPPTVGLNAGLVSWPPLGLRSCQPAIDSR